MGVNMLKSGLFLAAKDSSGETMGLWIAVIAAIVIFTIVTILYLAKRYKRCPSDQILVIYGKVERDKSSRCMHDGGTLVWPLIQDFAFLSLTPLTISIPLKNALSLQNIRINVPSTFTVGISIRLYLIG